MTSEIILGGVGWGELLDAGRSRAVIRRALDLGVNAFDTANVYGSGRSEEILGEAVRADRDDVLIFSKVGLGAPGPGSPMNRNGRDLSRRAVIDAAHASLRRLGTDRIDLYQLHCWDDLTPIEETLSALDYLVTSGSVRYVGCSNYAGWQVQRALARCELGRWPTLVTMQTPYSMVSRAAEAEIFPSCAAGPVGVLAYQVLAGGILSGAYQFDRVPPVTTRIGSRNYLQRDYWNPDVFAVADGVTRAAAEFGMSRAARGALGSHAPGCQRGHRGGGCPRSARRSRRRIRCATAC
jgi:aryl-alcohol dehydrogenase-like predicted oxidoreductase